MDKDKRKKEMLKLRKEPYCYTLEQIGMVFKISRQRVNQIIGKTKRGKG